MQNSINANSDEKQILTAYGKKIKVRIFFTGEGRTKQSFKAECDINTIIDRYLKTGVMEFTQKNEPRYGDVTGLDYQNAMQIVAGAKSLFNELPAHVRDRFDNEPALFLDFVQDPANTDEARELGLLKPLPPPETPARRAGEGAGGEGGVSPPQGAPAAPAAPAAPQTNTST